MARVIPWRQKCPTEVHSRVVEASSSGLLVVQQPGPTSFVLKCPTTQKKFKVLIGTEHKCQCPQSKKELCVHILFVLSKVFRIPADNPMLWQRSLLEAEIDQLARGRTALLQRRTGASDSSGGNAVAPPPQSSLGSLPGSVPRRPIEDGDTCPICCDDIDESKPLVYCRFGCGNSLHSSCFRAYATHNSTNPTPLQCPLCRCKWGDLASSFEEGKPKPSAAALSAMMAASHGVGCSECRTLICGERYHCAFCASYDLCDMCFANPLVHPQHPFDVSLGPGLSFQPAVRPVRQTVAVLQPAPSTHLERAVVAPASSDAAARLLAELQHREIRPEDYEHLLRLDESVDRPPGSLLTEIEVSRLPHTQFTPGAVDADECAICLAPFDHGDILIGLPLCDHFFHAECAVKWLTEGRAHCPVDGLEVPRLPPPSGATDGGPAVSQNMSRRPRRVSDSGNHGVGSASQQAQWRPPRRNTEARGHPSSAPAAQQPHLDLVLNVIGIGTATTTPNTAGTPVTVENPGQQQRQRSVGTFSFQPRQQVQPAPGAQRAVRRTAPSPSTTTPTTTTPPTLVVAPSSLGSEPMGTGGGAKARGRAPAQHRRAHSTVTTERGSAAHRPSSGDLDALFVGLSAVNPDALPRPQVVMPIGGRPGMLATRAVQR